MNRPVALLRLRALVSAVLLAAASPAFAQFSVTELPGQNVVSAILEKVEDVVNTRGTVQVTVHTCGDENAWWDGVSEISLCREVFEKIALKARGAVRAGKSDADTVSRNSVGEVMFFLFHEIAHALVQRHGIPVTDDEEAVADRFAAWLIMTMDDADLYAGAAGFFDAPARMARVFGSRRFRNEYDINARRRAQLACWGYGRSPEAFAALAGRYDVEESRLAGCADEYRQLMTATPQVFRRALRR